jgi:hypothetical protein
MGAHGTVLGRRRAVVFNCTSRALSRIHPITFLTDGHTVQDGAGADRRVCSANVGASTRLCHLLWCYRDQDIQVCSPNENCVQYWNTHRNLIEYRVRKAHHVHVKEKDMLKYLASLAFITITGLIACTLSWLQMGFVVVTQSIRAYQI